MSVFVVLLRGINVGGHRKVPMAELRELLANSGYANVQTYIQSGNNSGSITKIGPLKPRLVNRFL